MERERGEIIIQIIMLLKIFLEIICTLLNKRVNLYRGVFLYSLCKGICHYRRAIFLTNNIIN